MSPAQIFANIYLGIGFCLYLAYYVYVWRTRGNPRVIREPKDILKVGELFVVFAGIFIWPLALLILWLIGPTAKPVRAKGRWANTRKPRDIATR